MRSQCEASDNDSVLTPFFRLVKIAVLSSWAIPFLMLAYNVARKVRGLESACEWTDLGLWAGWMLTLFLLTGAALLRFARSGAWVERIGAAQVHGLNGLPDSWVGFAIVVSAGLSLLLELVVIRWQGTVFEVFAFYKGLTLLACFLGLGVGYAMAGRTQIPLLASVPLLVWQCFVLLATRYGPTGWNPGILRAAPFAEQLHMGLDPARNYEYAAVLLLLLIVFLLTALVFIPIGQLCGCLMRRRPRLRAYGLNLAGSLLGVVMMFALSLGWSPPAIWFGLCFAGLLLFQAFDATVLLFGTIWALLGVGVLSWPVATLWERIYSPYQLIERGPGEEGLTTIRAAGNYYQRIMNFSTVSKEGHVEQRAAYYALPYRLHRDPGHVAIVGAGTGNDVAMALRMGARHVDAVEIDPVILAVGKDYHPERPYQDPRVRPINDDARSFLRSCPDRYDLVVYGLLDSHTLLSSGSSVRLDSFVYTVEAFREARSRLREGGVLSLSFCVLSPEMGRKIFQMLQEAFDGVPPVCVSARYDGAVVFVQGQGSAPGLSPDIIDGVQLVDVTARFADPGLRADVSTDDWPFFYVPRRAYPFSYALVAALILGVSVVCTRPFLWARPRVSYLPSFLLGAGFMLFEIKSVTELGLTFGNTWQVVGIVIAGILVMACLANGVVDRFQIRRLVPTYVLLLASIVAGIAYVQGGAAASTTAGRLATLAVMTSPLFFSGIAFSIFLEGNDDVSGVMAANLLGAMFGGLLEYNAMYFGFTFLSKLALFIYAAAFVSSAYFRKTSSAQFSCAP